MKRFNFGVFGLVLGGMLLLGTNARAVTVSYTTIGTFLAGTGNNESPTDGDTFRAAGGGVVIRYEPNQTTNYELEFGEFTIADFGSFIVETSLPTDTDVSADFELQIVQFDPSFGVLDYFGTLQGTLRIGRSGAFVDFDGPLVQSLGLVIYELIERDQGVPGRVALNPASFDVLGNLVEGRSTIEAQITLIPEPSTVVLMGMGAVAPLGLALRRRMKGRATA